MVAVVCAFVLYLVLWSLRSAFIVDFNLDNSFCLNELRSLSLIVAVYLLLVAYIRTIITITSQTFLKFKINN